MYLREISAVSPALATSISPCYDLLGVQSTCFPYQIESTDFNDCSIVLMGYAPKRKKSVKMKRYERNRPWKIPEDIPYTTCSSCGAPRRVYFMCEVCYEKVKNATEVIQEPIRQKVAEMKRQILQAKTHLKYKPRTFEEQLRPYQEKYTLERLKPKPVEPILGETWKDTVEDYKKWYLEDGEPVLPPQTDQDIDLLSDPGSGTELQSLAVQSLADDDSREQTIRSHSLVSDLIPPVRIMEDPFEIVKEETEAAIADITKNLERWKKLASGTSSVAIQERNSVKTKILSALDSAQNDISDLEEAVQSIESDRNRFNISQDEIMNRKRFIHMAREQCSRAREQLSNPTFGSAGPSQNVDRYSAAQQSANRSNEIFIEKSMGQQQQIMREQDEQLSLVGKSIGRLKEIGTLIGDEVEDQNQLLDEFYGDMGQTEKRMSNVQRKMDKILEKVDGKKQNIIIGVLLVIMIIVVVLFFST
ncbi:hypothetical protein ACHWQZ_G015576 [Mnemiopsis leidyi]